MKNIAGSEEERGWMKE